VHVVVGLVHQRDLRAERAGRLQQAFRLLGIGVHQRLGAGLRLVRQPAAIDRRTGPVALRVAGHRDQKFLLLHAPQHRLAHRLVVERRMQVIERHEQLIAEPVIRHDHDVGIALHHLQ